MDRDRSCAVVRLDSIREITRLPRSGGALRRADDPAEVERAVGIDRKQALDAVAEVGRPYKGPVREPNTAPEQHRVRPPTVGRAWKGDREVAEQRAARNPTDAPVAEQTVIYERNEQP